VYQARAQVEQAQIERSEGLVAVTVGAYCDVFYPRSLEVVLIVAGEVAVG
jgi:hypothetical protein